MPPAAQQRTELTNFRFRVEIDGIQQAAFLECSGIGSEIEVTEYRDGSDPGVTRKFPGKISYPNITLKWGVTPSRDLYDWHLSALQGAVKRRNGTISLLDESGAVKVSWRFSNAWPCKFTGPSLSGKGTDVAIEELVIATEKVELV
jgi:phage tail-like protein